MTGGSGVRGFLFADLRGYTRYIEAHGDAAAAEFLADYRSLVRVVIGRHEGAEIRTEGDGVYVVFESVIGAVDAALELVESAASASAANRDRPMPVAVGVHAGETAATGEGPVGSAVNIASRICAKAEAGEVLVSETVRSLVRTARPYRSTALGSQHLKGVAEAIPLYRLERGPSRLGTRLGRQARARRRTLAAAGLGLAVLAVAGAGAWAINRPPDCLSLPASTKNVVVRIDLERGCVTTLIGVGFRPGPIVATPDALWIGDRAGWTLTRVDPVKGAVTAWLGVPGSPISIAAAATGDLAVLAYDDRTPEQQRLTSRHRVIFVDADPAQTGTGALLPVERPDQQVGFPINQTSYTTIAAASGWFWVASPRGTLIRVRQLGLATVDLSLIGAVRPGLVVSSGGTVWIADEGAPAAYRLDGLDSQPRSLSLGGSSGSQAVAATPTAIWLLRKSGELTRADLGTGLQTALPVEGSPTEIAVGSDGLWLVDPDGRVVRSIDPGTGRTIATVPVGGHPSHAVESDGALWVTISDD